MRGEITRSGDLFKFAYNDNEAEDTHEEFLQSLGYAGTAKSWKGVLFGLFKARNSALNDRVKVVVEGPEIVAYSPERGSLDHVQSLLDELKEDDQLFNTAVRNAETAGKME